MRRPLVHVLTALLCLAVSGCKVSQEDIDYWTGTVKGPGKIVAVLLADKYEDPLRVYAGLALVRMEPRPATSEDDPVDGVTELQAALTQLPEETRTRLVNQMADDLISMMRGEDTPQAAGEGEGIPPTQVRAKDAAFLLIAYASGEHREQLTNAVVDWFVVDFNGRSLAGNYTAEQVVRRLGAPAASRLVNALNARLPQQALVKIAELVAALGDEQTKQRAAERLVEIEREMEGEDFTDWLKDRLRQQLRGRQGDDAEIDENRVNAAAMLNRENFINLGALPAMKHLNDQRVVQERLMEIASQDSTQEHILVRRKTALLALEGGARPDHVGALLDIALVSDPPPRQNEHFDRLRDAAFDRVADTRSTDALPRMWETFQETESWVIRWRVGTVILTLGGNDVVADFFNRLDDEAYAQEELHGYGERLSQMRPPPTDFVNTQLESDDWYDRVIALYFWQRQAGPDDLGRITAHQSDDTPTQGEHWGGQNTVGKVAEAVAEAVRQRLQQQGGGGGDAGSEAAEGEEGGGPAPAEDAEGTEAEDTGDP